MARAEPKLKYLPWYWRDFTADTVVQTMGDAQKWWYMALLAHQFDEGSIGDSPIEWCRIVKPVDAVVGQPMWEEFVALIPRLFPVNEDGRRRNPRMALERETQIKVVTGHSKGGQTGRRNLEQWQASKLATKLGSLAQPLAQLDKQAQLDSSAAVGVQDAGSTTESSEPRPNGLVSPDSGGQPPNRNGPGEAWRAISAPALRAAHVPEAEIPDAIRNFWGRVRRQAGRGEASDEELVGLVREVGQRFPRGWNPARLWNTANGETWPAFQRELGAFRKRQPAKLADVLAQAAGRPP